MLKMFDIEFIRKKHFVEGWSIRKISRQLGVSRQSVRKALASSDPPRYRLTHHAHILIFQGESHRFRESRKRLGEVQVRQEDGD